MLSSLRASERKNKVADREATAFSIFYSNTLYFFILLVLFWFMRTFHPVMYVILALCLTCFFILPPPSPLSFSCPPSLFLLSSLSLSLLFFSSPSLYPYFPPSFPSLPSSPSSSSLSLFLLSDFCLFFSNSNFSITMSGSAFLLAFFSTGGKTK